MKFQKVGGNNKLDTILKDKGKELKVLKISLPFDELKKRVAEMKREVRDFGGALKDDTRVALIAEIKKASPQLGDINTEVDIKEQAKIYESSGANAISVLTDSHFKGEIGFLNEIRSVTTIPILRKDFIFDPYQIYESYYYGADALLLITTVLDVATLKELIAITHELGMECLVETHTEDDMKKALATPAEIVGINARNLKTFEVSLDNIVSLAKGVPKNRLLVAESGIESGTDVERLVSAGAKSILVGTTLMQAKDLGEKVRELKGTLMQSSNTYMTPRIKICGITNILDGVAIAHLGPEYMGFVISYPKSTRSVAPDEVREIISEIRKENKSVKLVGVFVDEDPNEIERVVKLCGLDIVQLHGNESPETVRKVKEFAEVWRVFIIKNADGIKQADTYRGIANKIMFDRGMGSGTEIDLSLFKDAHIEILAGGLGLKNVQSVLKKVSPDIVDASSKLEISPGKKDTKKVEMFIKIIRSTK